MTTEAKILKYKSSLNQQKNHQLKKNQLKRAKKKHRLRVKLLQHLSLWRLK
jgi:hypothetical protein